MRNGNLNRNLSKVRTGPVKKVSVPQHCAQLDPGRLPPPLLWMGSRPILIHGPASSYPSMVCGTTSLTTLYSNPDDGNRSSNANTVRMTAALGRTNWGEIPTGIVILNWMCHGQGLDLIILIINLNFHARPSPPPSPHRSLSQYASQLVHKRPIKMFKFWVCTVH